MNSYMVCPFALKRLFKLFKALKVCSKLCTCDMSGEVWGGLKILFIILEHKVSTANEKCFILKDKNGQETIKSELMCP